MYHNLVAHPEATFEAANDSFQVVAREATGDERQRRYDEHARCTRVRGVPEQDEPSDPGLRAGAVRRLTDRLRRQVN